MTELPRPGFYGKLPGHGDFIGRGLPRAFTDEWDQWLQRCVAESRAALGDEWTDTYLTSPIWRFVVGAELFGVSTWAGIVFPSVDRVGRYFPLTIAVATPIDVMTLQVVTSCGDWFGAAEELAWQVLDEEGYDADRLEQAVQNLGPIDLGSARLSLPENSRTTLPPADITVAIADGASPAQAVLVLAQALVDSRLPEGHSVWWTAGSAQVPPSLRVFSGLPAPVSYVGMMDTEKTTDLAVEPVVFELPDAESVVDSEVGPEAGAQ